VREFLPRVYRCVLVRNPPRKLIVLAPSVKLRYQLLGNIFSLFSLCTFISTLLPIFSSPFLFLSFFYIFLNILFPFFIPSPPITSANTVFTLPWKTLRRLFIDYYLNPTSLPQWWLGSKLKTVNCRATWRGLWDQMEAGSRLSSSCLYSQDWDGNRLNRYLPGTGLQYFLAKRKLTGGYNIDI
jgi:hypothetical protein